MTENLERLPVPRRRRILLYGAIAIGAAGATLVHTNKDTSNESRDVPATSTTAVYQIDTQTLPPTLPPGEVATTVAEGTILPIDHHPTTLPADTTIVPGTEQPGISLDATIAEEHDHPAPPTAATEVATQNATPAVVDTHQHPTPVIPAAEQPVAVTTTAATHLHPAPVVVATTAMPIATLAPTVETVAVTLAPVGTPETVPTTMAPPVGTIAAPAG